MRKSSVFWEWVLLYCLENKNMLRPDDGSLKHGRNVPSFYQSSSEWETSQMSIENVIGSCLFRVCLKYSCLIWKGTSFYNRGLPLFLCSKPKWSPLMTLSAVSHRTGRKCKECLPRCVYISSKPAFYSQNNLCLKKKTKTQNQETPNKTKTNKQKNQTNKT